MAKVVPVVKHASLSGAVANPNVLVDGPKWDASHTVTGLESLDNTADVDKPVSTAQAAALALKAPLAAPSFTGLITNGGGQIAFPATQIPSSDPNTLDDYEEGTWTPAVTGSTGAPTGVTYSVQIGFYTKIGNLVYYYLAITLTNAGAGGTGVVRVTGLPFTVGVASGAISPWIGSISLGNTTMDAGYSQVVVAPVASNTMINFKENGTAIATINMPYANLSNTTAFQVAGYYSV